ncbi:hypothetical protein LIER_42870 [Lithospermum erythrorhizon]|uniref:CCHC-type domain-containing protein n=1 Tax=Lithospermum erythrorhizon TaxID=34254 RepID=A0AAV3P2J8_LITER
MVEEHSCEISMKIDMVKLKFLVRKYINKIRRQSKIYLKNFIGDIYNDLNIEINVTIAWRAIKAAGYLLYGNENQQFARCRKFICVDGCFSKGAFKGQLLAAVGLDGNNGIYPIACAVVEQKGLENVIQKELPEAEHRLKKRTSRKQGNWKEKAKKREADGVFRASRKGAVKHCKICGIAGHNARSCPCRSELEEGSQPTPARKKRKTEVSSSQPEPSRVEE